MNPELLIPIGFVGIAVLIVLFSQLIAPRQLRRRLSAGLARAGWRAVVSEREPAWREIMKLAIEEHQGATASREFDEKRSGRAIDVFRDGGTSGHRYAAVGLRRTTVDSRGGPLYLFGRKRNISIARELWIGESRRLPVEKPALVYNAAAEMFGDAMRRMAGARDVDTEKVPMLVSPPDDQVSQSVRQVLLRTDLAQRILAKAYLGPQAWVLAVSLNRTVRRLEDVLALVRDISSAIDRVAR